MLMIVAKEAEFLLFIGIHNVYLWFKVLSRNKKVFTVNHGTTTYVFQGKTTEIVVINRGEGTRSAVHDTLPIFNVKVMQCNVFSEEDVNKKRPNQPTMTRYVKLRFCTKDF